MILLFSIDGTSDLYEKFLKDFQFHYQYQLRIRTRSASAYEFYRKNLHIIYCNKYKESDLELY